MSANQEARVVGHVATVDEYLEAVSLRDVGIREVSARHAAGGDGEPSAQADFTVSSSREDRQLRVTCRLVLETHRGEFVVEAYALYDELGTLELGDELVDEFAATEALSVTYPYIRAELPVLARLIGLGVPKLPPTLDWIREQAASPE